MNFLFYFVFVLELLNTNGCQVPCADKTSGTCCIRGSCGCVEMGPTNAGCDPNPGPGSCDVNVCNSYYVLVNRKCEPCGGFEGCKSYYDGCNTCSCTENGLQFCTKRACIEKTSEYCTTCIEDDYFLRNGACIRKVTCNDDSDCNSGFSCKLDPDCRSDESNSNCAFDKVCQRRRKSCTTDGRCRGNANCKEFTDGHKICVVFQA